MNTNCRLHDLLLIRGPIFPTNGIIGAPQSALQTSKPYTITPTPSAPPPPLLRNNGSSVFTPPKRRYSCPKCPYSTDRRDLYTRHENIHRDEKPFRCYVCEKMFNRADHVKKHFLRIHKGVEYDVKLTKRVKGRDYDVKESPLVDNNNNNNQNLLQNAKSAQNLSHAISQSNCFTANPLLSQLLYKRAFANPMPISKIAYNRDDHSKLSQLHYKIPIQKPIHPNQTKSEVPQQESNLKLVNNDIDYDLSLNKDSVNVPVIKSQNLKVQNIDENKDEDYQCEYCGCTFIDYCSLHTHRYLLHRYLLENNNYLPYRCAICGVRKITQRSMMSHMLNHNVFKSKVELKNNMIKKEERSSTNRRKQSQPRKIVKFINDFEDYPMEIEKRCSSEKNLISRAKFNCKICHKEFTTYTQLIHHKKFIKH